MFEKLGKIKIKGDGIIWAVFFILGIISIIEVFSASSGLTYKGGSYYGPALRHAGLLFVGFFFTVLTMNIKCKYFKLVTPFALIFSLFMLVAVLFMGQVTNGAQRWIGLFGIQFQPSELAKGAVVLATAQILSAMQTVDGADRHAFKYILIVTVPFILLIFTENFSTAGLLLVTVIAMMFIGRVPKRQLLPLVGGLFAVGALGVAIIWFYGKAPAEGPDMQDKMVLNDRIGAADNETEAQEKGLVARVFHRMGTWKGRMEDFLNHEEVPPEKVDLDKNGQKSHANIAIASSNVIGKGPGNSVERDFLSQAFSDFIFAIIIEEMGIGGAFIVCLLYLVLLFRTATIANRCANAFPALLIMGIALMLVVQAMFNMCVAVGLAPVTGQPLPLVSRGGTSTIVNCIYIGVILSVSYTAKRKDANDAAKKLRPVRAKAS